MCEQQSSVRIWAVTRLQPDLGAAHLGQDLPGPARILVLACLYLKVAELCGALFNAPFVCDESGWWKLGFELSFVVHRCCSQERITDYPPPPPPPPPPVGALTVHPLTANDMCFRYFLTLARLF